MVATVAMAAMVDMAAALVDMAAMVATDITITIEAITMVKTPSLNGLDTYLA